MNHLDAVLTVNGRRRRYRGDGAMPLLWFLRDELRLTGTKYGCGEGQCGACTVHVAGRAARSCVTPMSAVAGRAVRTIEGLARPVPAPAPGGATAVAPPQGDEALHPVQQAWLDEDVAQCGYCQAGQIMAAVDLLQRMPRPTDADIDRAITNLCRCGTQMRVRRAIHRAAALMLVAAKQGGAP
ncbi:MAG: (2Fe-2S)-binding protein [Rubrivivax sp.]|nr:(2Fe-2S)-binding protein [Rubrivivax sp.]